MNSGYSRLSTSLYIKNSSPQKEDDSKNRFRKVSLVNETDTTELNQDIVDFNRASTTVTESNETDLASEYKWRNKFEGVSQYKPHKPEESSLSYSLSYKMPDTDSSNYAFSSSSAVPEAIAYKHHSNIFSSSPFSPPPEEHITLGNKLGEVYLSCESEPAEEPKDEWRRSFVEQEEPAAPAGKKERQSEGEAEPERIQSRWDSQQLPVSGFSSVRQTSRDATVSFTEEDDESAFTGVFKAMRVELVSDPAAPPSTPPASPDIDSPNQFDMESLVDTLKNMGPSLRPRSMGQRGPPQVLHSSLPPIVEDAPNPVTSNIHNSPTSLTNESLNGLYTLPADLGLKKSSGRDTRSPLELMKQTQV